MVKRKHRYALSICFVVATFNCFVGEVCSEETIESENQAFSCNDNHVNHDKATETCPSSLSMSKTNTASSSMSTQQSSINNSDKYSYYRDGTYVPTITEEMISESDQLAKIRQKEIHEMMKNVWYNYKRYAWGYDEIKPLSRKGSNCWGGMGTTLVDSLSTLWLLNMTKSFNEAKKWITQELTFNNVGRVSVFETTIRNLGGLLSAYDLSGDPIFLKHANDLGKRLLKSFDTPSGIPYGQTVLDYYENNITTAKLDDALASASVTSHDKAHSSASVHRTKQHDGNSKESRHQQKPRDLTTIYNKCKNNQPSCNTPWHEQYASLAELGTLQIEFRYLSRMTLNPEYETKVMAVFDLLEYEQPKSGLLPIFLYNLNTNGPSIPPLQPNPNRNNDQWYKISIGALGDSFYEYLLKVWLQGNKKESKYRNMYDKAMNGLHKYMIHKSYPNKLTYITEIDRFNKPIIVKSKDGRSGNKMDHLSCFTGGNLVLGAYTNPKGLQSADAQRDFKVGKELAYTCYQMYRQTLSGLSPESVIFFNKSVKGTTAATSKSSSSSNKDFIVHDESNILRPETVETIYILYTLTGDPTYREWGYNIYQSIEKYCKLPGLEAGTYASLKNVNKPSFGHHDRMESFFISETIKYLYLLFSDNNENAKSDLLNNFVFNTEAHPLRVLDQI